MSAAKKTTLFTNGGSQSLRIPADMRLKGSNANIIKVGGILIVTEDEGENPFLALEIAQSLISSDFMSEGRDLLEIKEREEV